jgi:ankyrin repeat protein
MNVSATNRVQQWHRIQDHVFSGQHLDDSAALAARLLAAGADPNVADLAGQTALFLAAEANNVDVATVLLQFGANPNISTDAVSSEEGRGMGDQSGSTPLMRAYNWYTLTLDPTMVQLLLDHGADPNYGNNTDYDSECDTTTQGKCTFEGQTVLTRAAEDGDYTVVRVLLDHGADPHVSRSDGALPADIARTNGHAKVADLIESYLSKHSRANR